MNSDEVKKRDAEKKDDGKKILITFIAMLAVSVIVGFVIGVISSVLKAEMDIISFEEIKLILYKAVPIFYGVFIAVLSVISLIIYSKNVREAKSWDGEDEEIIDRIEARQNIPMILSSIMMIVGMLLFSICAYLDMKINAPGNWIDIKLFSVIFLILTYVMTFLVQKLVIGLEKKLNPEKRGDIFDFNFQKKWQKSSDEAEKLIQYKGGYKAYLAGNFACIVLWIVTMIGMYIFGTGLMGVVSVTVIWLVMTIVYSYEVARLEKKKH